MAVKVLVASPISSFGELIRTTLTSHGEYQVVVCETGDQVLDTLAGEAYDVLILDSMLSDQPFAPLVQKITASLPSQKIAVIPPENKPDHPALENVIAHGFLFRPFLDPDLINLVQRLASAAEQERNEQKAGAHGMQAGEMEAASWADDPDTASAELSRLLLGSSALAGLVIRDGQLFVRAGRISAEASQEINQMLSQVRKDNEKDLVRFTFLVADDCEALVYAVNLTAGWIMALVYDVSMPLTRVRSQATALAGKLREHIRLEDIIVSKETDAEIHPAASPAEDAEEEESDDVDISAIMNEIRTSKVSDSDEFLNISSLDDELFSLINEVNETPKDEDAKTSGRGEGGTAGSSDLLYSQAEKSGDSGEEHEVVNEPEFSGHGALPDSKVNFEEPAEGQTSETAGEAGNGGTAEKIADAGILQTAAPMEEKRESTEEDFNSILAEMPAVDESDLLDLEAALGQAQEVPATDIQSIIDQHLASQGAESEHESEKPREQLTAPSTEGYRPAYYARMKAELTTGNSFTVVFVPRTSGLFLTGELAAYLGDLLKKSNTANPWKLTGVSIRPEYLKISLDISEYLEPAEIIEFIKEFTGSALKNKFPKSAGEKFSDSFWAEETLTGSDGSSIEGDRLNEFVQTVKANSANPS